MRLPPEVRALCERMRRPAVRMLLGGALMMPAAAMMAGSQFESISETRALATNDAALVGERLVETDAVARQWRERMLNREREFVAASFAREFDIPLKLAQNIHLAALEADIEPQVAFGLVRAESSFRTTVVSPVGAVGLTQVLPSTGNWMVPGTTRRDLMQPETNLRVGFKYLRYLIDKYDGDQQLALTAYNRGPGTVNRLLARGRNPDNGYAEKVMTGQSQRHVNLMNAKFGRRGRG